MITYAEAGFLISREELEQLLTNKLEAEPAIEAELAGQNDFGDPNKDQVDNPEMNDLFIFGENKEQALLDALDNGVEQTPADQNWLSQTEEAQGNNESNLNDLVDHTSKDESESSTYDDQPCGW